MNKQQLRDAINTALDQSIITGDGFTMAKYGLVKQQHGFVVMTTNRELSDENREALVDKAVDYLLGVEKAFTRTIGFWYDSEIDECFFDEGFIILRERNAQIIGKTYGQKAIWSLLEKKAITVDYSGGLN